MNRRGQTEDFFADFIIAIVIIVIAILLSSMLGTGHKTNIKEQIEDITIGDTRIKSADIKMSMEIDIITLLRTEWKTDETIQQGLLRMHKEGKNKCEDNFQDFLQDHFKEFYTEIWSFDLISNNNLLISCKSDLSSGGQVNLPLTSINTLIPFPLEDGQIVYVEATIYE